MRFTLSTSAFLALVSTVIAQTPGFDPITVPTSNEVLSSGAPFTVQWTVPAQYASDTITIELIGGATQATQQVLATLASELTMFSIQLLYPLLTQPTSRCPEQRQELHLER